MNPVDFWLSLTSFLWVMSHLKLDGVLGFISTGGVKDFLNTGWDTSVQSTLLPCQHFRTQLRDALQGRSSSFFSSTKQMSGQFLYSCRGAFFFFLNATCFHTSKTCSLPMSKTQIVSETTTSWMEITHGSHQVGSRGMWRVMVKLHILNGLQDLRSLIWSLGALPIQTNGCREAVSLKSDKKLPPKKSDEERIVQE